MPMSWMMVLFHYELLHFCIWIGEAYTKSRKLGKKNKNSPTSSEFVSSDSPESSGASSPSNENGNNVGEIPAESPNKKATLQWTLPQAVIHGSKINKYKRGQTNEANSDSDNE